MAEGTLHIKDSRTNKEYQIPIRNNAVAAADIKKIKGDPTNANPALKVANGLRIFDPSLGNTAIDEGKMTWINGETGVILFRGYTPDQLREKDFEDVLHLCVWDELPSPSQREQLRHAIALAMTKVPDSVLHATAAFPPSAPPMSLVIAGLSAYIADDPSWMPSYSGGEQVYHHNAARSDKAVIDAVAALGVCVALADCRQQSRKFTQASINKSFYENLFIMMGRVDPSTGKPDATKISVIRRWGNTIMDHGLTNSTFALRITASSLADPISCLISSLAAACGPLHFGAQEAAYRTMVATKTPENAAALIERVKVGKQRLHGLGHRSYSVTDPRVSYCRELLAELGTHIEYLDVAERIDAITAEDEYFTKRRLKPNADLYAQFFYVALGWGPEWSPIFTFVQRLPGYMAHWRRAMRDDVRLLRPTDLYVGTTEPRNTSKL